MIILDATTKSLEVLMDASGVSTDLMINSVWADWASGTPAHTPGHTGIASNGVTAVTVAAAPAASTQRQIKSCIVYNGGSVTHTVTLRINDNSTMRILGIISLGAGASADLAQFTSNATAAIGTAFDELSANAVAAVTKTGNATFTSADAAKWLKLADSSTQACILPAANAVGAGVKIAVFNDTTASGTAPIVHTVTRAGSDTIVGSSGALTSVSLLTSNFAVFESDGSSKWYIRQCRWDTGWIDGGAITITGSSSNPTKGSGISTDKVYWRRIGGSIECSYQYRQTGAGASGSGFYKYKVGGSFTIDSTYIQTTEFIGLGSAYLQSTAGGAQVSAGVFISDSATFSVYYNSSASAVTSAGSANFKLGDAVWLLYMTARAPITGWAI